MAILKRRFIWIFHQGTPHLRRGKWHVSCNELCTDWNNHLEHGLVDSVWLWEIWLPTKQLRRTFFLKHRSTKVPALIIYVDDIIITGDDAKEISRLQEQLSTEFEMKNLGGLKYFLGIEISRSRQGIFLCKDNMYWTCCPKWDCWSVSQLILQLFRIINLENI